MKTLSYQSQRCVLTGFLYCIGVLAQLVAQENQPLLEFHANGFDASGKPRYVIQPEPNCDIHTSIYSDRSKPMEAFSVKRDSNGLLFRIETEGDTLLPAGYGILVVIWAKPKSDDVQGRIQLGVTTKSGNAQIRYLPMLSPPIKQGRWARLAGWYFAEEPEYVSFHVSVPEKGEYLFDQIEIWMTPKSLPPDHRPFIRVDGGQLKAGEKPIVLNGVNLYAYSDDEKDETLHPMVSVDEDDYANIALHGFNVVRLNLWHKILRQPEGWAWLDLHRMWAREHGIRIILDLHAPPGGYQGPEYKGKFWRDQELQLATIAFWREVAAKLSGDPTIAAFDLLNEPCPKKDADWWYFVERAIPEIRNAGWHQPIVVERSFAKDATFRALSDKSIVYDYHFYDPWDFCSGKTGEYGKAGAISWEQETVIDKEWMKKTLDEEIVSFAVSQGVPVNIGEYGIMPSVSEKGGNQWLKDFCGLANQHNINRQYWCWHNFDWGLSDTGWHRYAPSSHNEDIIAIITQSDVEQGRGANALPRAAHD